MITIRNKDEMEKYYIEEVETVVFNDDVEFLCDINVKANIYAYNIKASNINYYVICFSYNNIECNSIKGRYPNSKHLVLDGELIIKGEENK